LASSLRIQKFRSRRPNFGTELTSRRSGIGSGGRRPNLMRIQSEDFGILPVQAARDKTGPSTKPLALLLKGACTVDRLCEISTTSCPG